RVTGCEGVAPMTESACVEASDRDGDDVDPFRLLVRRRAEAEVAGSDPRKTRKRAFDEAFGIIQQQARKDARFYHDQYVREEAVQWAMVSLLALCNNIYDGVTPPPMNWKRYVRTAVKNKGITVWRIEKRGGGKGLREVEVSSIDQLNWMTPLGEVVGAEGGVADAALFQIRLDALLERIDHLLADIESGEQVCAFHPGRRCPHVRTGSVAQRCKHLNAVIAVVRTTLSTPNSESIHKELIARTGLGGNRQGHTLMRNVYRCADWFSYLLLRHPNSASVLDQPQLAELENRIFDHLARTGPDAPSATTICILMNYYPDIPIPARLTREYGPIHLERPEGESR
ncbi:MAG: hypothetical protein ACRDRG_16620, partial [Pseudonocardiaceae bacterium]